MKPAQLFPYLLAIATMACLPPKPQVEFEARLIRWVGQPVSAFIQANRHPASFSVRPGGGRIYVFAKSSSTPISFEYKEYVNYDTGQRVVQGAGSQPPDWMNDGGGQRVSVQESSLHSESNRYCRVMVETDAKDIILAVRYEGNDCWPPDPLFGSPSSGMTAAQ